MTGVERATHGGLAPKDRCWLELALVIQEISAQVHTLTDSGGRQDDRVNGMEADKCSSRGVDKQGEFQAVGGAATSCFLGGKWRAIQDLSRVGQTSYVMSTHQPSTPMIVEMWARRNSQHIYASPLMSTEVGMEARSIIGSTPSEKWVGKMAKGGPSCSSGVLTSQSQIAERDSAAPQKKGR